MNYFYIILFILLAILGYYLVNYFLKSYHSKKTEFVENNEYKNEPKKMGKVFLFYTTWCPHCKPTLKKFDDIYSKFNDDRFLLDFIKVDCDKETDLASEYKVKEYPTIIMELDGKRFIYDTNLEESTFLKFSNAVIESL